MAPLELTAKHDISIRIDAVNLKHRLRDIETHGRDAWRFRRCDFFRLLQKQDSNEEQVGLDVSRLPEHRDPKPDSSSECRSCGGGIPQSDWRCPRLRKIGSQSAPMLLWVCAGFGGETEDCLRTPLVDLDRALSSGTRIGQVAVFT